MTQTPLALTTLEPNKRYHVTELAQALELCAYAALRGIPTPTFTVDADDFRVFARYMAKSYTVTVKIESVTYTVQRVMPLFEPVGPGDPRGEPITQKKS